MSKRATTFQKPLKKRFTRQAQVRRQERIAARKEVKGGPQG